MMKKLLIVFTMIISLVGFGARAEDEGLYDPAPPAESAFVRFVNLGSDSSKPMIGHKSFDSIKSGEVGSYVPAKKGEANLRLDKAEAKQNLEEGAFYTVVMKGQALTALKDDTIANPAKSMIAFYNLTGKEGLSLKTADGKVEVIPAAAAGKSGYREINGVKVNLAVYQGETKAADVAAVALRRREPTSIVVTQKEDGALQVQIVPAKTDTTQ